MINENVLAQIKQLNAQQMIRNQLNKYMEICDALNANTDIHMLMDLFDEDAIWEGIGERYSKSFGRYESKANIRQMFESYMAKDSHFVMNAHFVTSEQIYIHLDGTANTHWMMLQSSSFKTGQSHLNAAKLNIVFKQQTDDSWKILHFQTENIFSRPISHWDSQHVLPVPHTQK